MLNSTCISNRWTEHNTIRNHIDVLTIQGSKTILVEFEKDNRHYIDIDAFIIKGGAVNG